MTNELTAPAIRALQSDKFTVEEISTAVTIAKSTETILTRDNAVKTLDDFETFLHIHINTPAPWLRSIKLSRTASMLGARMRHIRIPQMMDGLDISKLSGLVTFVVLCCRYTEDTSSINEILQRLVAGNIGNLVTVQLNQEEHGRVLRNLRPHLGALAASSIDADKNSDVSNRAMAWMRQLHTLPGLDYGWAPKELLTRQRQASIHLMQELLLANNPAGEDEQSAPTEAWLWENRQFGCSWAKVYDTLYLTSAQIALAAAAHNASVAVRCMYSGGFTILPRLPDPEEQKSTVLVRLWIRQPPNYVQSILRYLQYRTDPTVDDEQETHDGNVVVVGGPQEIVSWVGKKLDFGCKDNSLPWCYNTQEALFDLWEYGVEFGKTVRWQSLYDASRMMLQVDQVTVPKFPESTQTEKQLSKKYLRILSDSLPFPSDDAYLGDPYLERPSLTTLGTMAARATEHIYRKDGKAEVDFPLRLFSDGEARSVILCFITSVFIQALRNAMHPDSDSLDTYALNLSALVEEPYPGRIAGDIATIAYQSLVRGVELGTLVAAAATIWGGERQSILQTHRAGTVGIVSPYCTVILDVIRQPFSLYEMTYGKDLPPLLSIWRGAVPLLPRDRLTGCVNTSDEQRRLNGTTVGRKNPIARNIPITRIRDTKPQGPLLVTFDVLDAQNGTGTFCFWYSGHLVAEFSPCLILSGLAGAYFLISGKEQRLSDDNKPDMTLSKGDLLEIAGFDVDPGSIVTVEDVGDVAWFIFALGCVTSYCADGSPIFNTEPRRTFENPRTICIRRFRSDRGDEQVQIVIQRRDPLNELDIDYLYV